MGKEDTQPQPYRIEIDLSKGTDVCVEMLYKQLTELPLPILHGLEVAIEYVPLTRFVNKKGFDASGVDEAE